MANMRQHLSAPGLLTTTRSAFSKVKDWRKAPARIDYSLTDVLMSGIAIFGMKYPSLLSFNDAQKDPAVEKNLANLYGVKKAPSDTRMREILDPVDPNALRPAFKSIFAKLQDGKALVPFRFLEDTHLVSVDGTGFFSSHDVHCDNCCIKKSRNGSITYYHQMLAAVVVHPSQKQVIPLIPEAIIKQDGATKNDCEINAAKRLIASMRRDHPFLKITLLGDGLFSKGPMIKLARDHGMGFIFGAKPGDHPSIFGYLEDGKELGAVASFEQVEDGVISSFSFINDLPLNTANPDLTVNLLHYTETRKGKVTTFSWVTDINLTNENVYQVMRGGRARWRIENETFNTLKNQGYQFEHNFGHGNKNLSTIFAHLMLLAFLIDQVQELCCPIFKEMASRPISRSYMWERMRSFFLLFIVESWGFLYACLIHGYQSTVVPNSS